MSLGVAPPPLYFWIHHCLSHEDGEVCIDSVRV